jgi:plasmid stability protein
MNSLDNILAGGEAVPEEKEVVEQVTQAVEGESQPEPTEAAADGDKQRMVPHEALHAEKQKVKRYTEEVSEFRKQLAESNAAWERRVASILEAQKPKEAPQPAPDFFENPQAATRHEVTQAVGPQFDGITQQLMAQAQMLAGIKYGDDKVAEAEQAFMTAHQTGKLDPSDFQRVASSPNRYAEAVRWHQRQLAQAEIGDDPAAYRARLEAELRDKITAELQQGTQTQAPALMPSNLAAVTNKGTRSGVPWSGPKPFLDIFNR